MVNINELTKLAEKNNNDLRRWYAKEYKLKDEIIYSKDGSYDRLENDIDEKIKDMLSQRKKNIEAKYRYKKDRELK